MPYINGRYYMNPFYGAMLERGLATNPEADMDDDLFGNDNRDHLRMHDDVYHPGVSGGVPEFSDEVFRYGDSAQSGEPRIELLAARNAQTAKQGHTPQPQQPPAHHASHKPAHRSQQAHSHQAHTHVTVYPHEKKIGGSASWRNNNPANIMYSPNPHSIARLYGATGKDGGGRAIFPTMDAGKKAQDAIWHGHTYQGLTIEGAAKRWTGCGDPKTPGCENPAVLKNYVHMLSTAAGAPPNTPISRLSRALLDRLKAAQVHQEGFRPGITEPTVPNP